MTTTDKFSALRDIATRLRIHSVQMTTQAGSGHPSTCCSAADIMAALFFGGMRFDPKNPKNPGNDRFVLSKGHGAPILYAAWAEVGHIPVDDLMKLRTFGSNLEGHPTPRLDFVDVATGSLGQGLSAGVGMALFEKNSIYVLMGDGELAEGSVWEAASFAGIHPLSRLVAIVDANGLGQSAKTAFGDQIEVYRSRFAA